MNYKIIPCVGFDKIKFGMTRDEVMAQLGQPDEIQEDQNYGDTPDELVTVFYYDEIGVSMSFDKEADYRLTEMSFENEEFTLCDTIRVGMPVEKVFEAIEKSDYDFGECYEETLDDEESDGGRIALFVCEDCGISLWFEEGELSTIQAGPAWIDDDTIDWPE